MASLLLGGAVGVAAYDFLKSKGQRLSITDKVVTNMTVNATAKVSTTCFSSLSGSQTVNITATGGNFTSVTPGSCSFCLGVLNDIRQARLALEGEAAQRNPAYSPQFANPVWEAAMVTGQLPSPSTNNDTPTQSASASSKSTGALGPCEAMCADVLVVGVDQTEKFVAQQTCTVSDDITTTVQQELKGRISASLKNQQDIVGQAVSELTSDRDSISANLAQNLAQNVTTNFVQSLTQEMFNAQVVNIQGFSILADGVSQGFTGSQIGSLAVTNTVVDQLRQSAQYSISQTLLNKQDTVGDLTNDFLGVVRTMSQLVQDLTTQILLILGTILLGVAVTAASLYVFNREFHHFVRHTVRHQSLMRSNPAYAAAHRQAAAQ